ncbi:TOR1 [Sanghuangporus sanghuang]
MSSADAPAQVDPLDRFFGGLKSKNPEARLQSALELRKHVQNVVVEMSSDAAAKLWEELTNKRLIHLAHGATSAEKLGAIVAIEHLLDLEKEETIETKRNCFRFYNYVKFALPSPDYNVMQTAAEALGKIVQVGGAVFDDRFTEYEVQAAIELIQSDRQEPARYAGVLILKELAIHNPTCFYQHISLVFDKILIPLRDQRLIVRETAADLLAACLDIIIQRERQSKAPFLTKILQDAQTGLRSASAETIHGSLLTYRVLLLHAGMFMKESYVETAESILKLCTHRDALVRKTVISLIPTLALYDTQTFSEYFMYRAMLHLLDQLQKPAERSVAFTAIGQVATAVGSDMKQFLEPIMEQIKSGLQMRGKKNAPAEEPMFQCIGMLASAVGPNLTKLLHDQLDLMFACGLSESLRQALIAIARHIPPLLRTIQDRLLDLISITLSGQHYKPLGASPSYHRPEMAAIKDIAVQQSGATKAPEQIRLALETLGSFDFSGHILNEFVRSCALPYLEDDHPDIRQAAALTCCRLFVRDPICHQVSNHSIEIISDVLDKLLTVAIADPDPAIRLTVLSSLDERFDKHLSQAENVRSLFIALNDEVFENRVTAIGLIGRLAVHNPAYVMASLRKALIQLLTELEYSTVIRAREECTKLLSLLINAMQRLIKPYAVSMLVALLPKANDPNPTVSANILACIGELACVGADDVLPLVPRLMETILKRLTDPVPVKRDAALRALGQVSSSTGYVIQPLVDHPELFQILGRILKTDAAPPVRREVIKVLGILGAIDPYRRRTRADDDQANETAVQAVNMIPLPTTASSDDYFQTVVINHLLDILKDQTLSLQHHTVIEAIMSIFKTQGLKCVAFLPQIIPAFANVTRNVTAARHQEFHLQQLAILVGIIKEHVRNYTIHIFNLAQALWDNAALQLPIVGLIEALGKALDGEFKPFLPTILPLMLRVFDGDLQEKKQATQMKVLDAFLTFGANIEEYLHLVIPIIVRSYERQDASVALRKRAVQTIDGLTRWVNFSDHASRIIHPLVRALSTPNNELRAAIMETLSSLVLQLGSEFAIFIPTINKALLKNKVHNQKYEALITKLLNGERLPQDGTSFDVLRLDTSLTPEYAPPAESTKMTVNQQHLKQAWDVSQIVTKEDWNDWMQRLSVELMKESPSHALRACMTLVGEHPPLARALFNAAFLSCWTELYDQYQEDLVRAIETAITSPTIPTELAHRLLNLAEFMEHEDRPLPIENRTLGEYALTFHAYAKALHYKELEYFTESSPAVIEDLININTRLQQHDAAWGTLTLAREQYDVSRHEQWYERLGRWSEALQAYDRKISNEPDAQEEVWGRMRCLHALGEWEQLAAQVDENWANATNEQRRDMAGMGAAAAWALNEWDNMENFIAGMKGDSPERSFFKAILAVHRNQFSKALTHINKARDMLDPELTALVGESYGRTYNIMIRAQSLSELEEIIQYKQFADQPDRQASMKRTWMKRLQGCQPDVETWQRVLQVRTLVSQPEEDSTMWIKFANLCRKSDRMVLADKTINSLLASPSAQYRETQHIKAAPDVVYAQLKFMWANNAKDEAVKYLRSFTSSLAHNLSEAAVTTPGKPAVSTRKLEEMSSLLARCYYKQGQWQQAMKKGIWSEENIKDILQAYYLATHYDTTWYKAWHTWALANFEVIGYLESQHDRADALPGNNLAIHVVQAVQGKFGFFRSIQLRNENSLQDTLRLLTLWFKFGSHDDVSNAMATGFSIVDVDTWLDVIPQIIARIQTPSVNIRRNIDMLLTDVGKHHPQALIYPLTVASQSSSISRKNAALAIMDRMRDHSATIVEQALLVSQELIRVAILWHELWHEGLEEASRFYYTEKNPEGMIAVLEPLHEKLERGPTTVRETSFTQVFGRDLREAREACRRYLRYGDPIELDKAWEIYYAVFRKIEKQMPQLVTLDLQYVSPELLKARNLELAVPGTYQSGREIVRIASFAPKLTVISSKQRPRRLSVKGSDGRDYQYLLKGHEDLRQDERVMQLFSLVNTLLSIDTASFKRRLHIQRFAVIPLAPNAGLIGWIQDSDTLHVLVRDYRDSRKILLNIEYRLMLQMAPDYESLILLQKVEVFEYALDNTTGQDLYRVLWLKSQSSEHWIERRATYTRSLAVNSMVGHILGLGDRHPSNVLLERYTGKVVHIDFGDCFEVAMLREKFPEKVPFRLTRMLTHAMEVSGIQGSFKNTCEISMQVLRDNKESLMAVLEAFVYDPLINWRLLQADVNNNRVDELNDATRAEQLARVSGHPQGPGRKVKADENEIFNENPGEPGPRQEVRDKRALFVYNRVQHKLTGRDFNPDVELTVPQQVEKLIQQATSLENLCQCFSGWCAFW